MILPPPQDHQMSTSQSSIRSQPFTGASSSGPAFTDSPFSQPSPAAFANHSTSWTPTNSTTPISTNPSRKRSRDETSFESEIVDGSYFPSQQVNTPAPIPEEEPIYGEGMTLIYPSSAGMVISAESQTGTWYEEKVEDEANVKNQPSSVPDRPEMPTSRKSQRLDTSAPGLDDITLAAMPSNSPPKSGPVEPSIDDFTHLLGIGWTRTSSEDDDMQAAARGWARYIDNHYGAHVHGAEILLKSKGLSAYLVGAREGFFLFSEDLSEGRLVGGNEERCLENLKNMPPTFEGTTTLRAEKSPGPEIAAPGFLMAQQNDLMEEDKGVWMETVNGVNGVSHEERGMDID